MRNRSCSYLLFFQRSCLLGLIPDLTPPVDHLIPIPPKRRRSARLVPIACGTTINAVHFGGAFLARREGLGTPMSFIRDNDLQRMRVVRTGNSDLPSGCAFLGLLKFCPSGVSKGQESRLWLSRLRRIEEYRNPEIFSSFCHR
jgi:hypothetical protein